jgi:tRNA (guanine37-N1)-methyltransferase
MKFTVITLFPQMIEQLFSQGIVGQGLKKGLVQVSTINPRDSASDVHKTVDDRPFGGGDGMIMQAEILESALKALPEAKVIYLSPQGRRLDDKKVRALAQEKEVALICGRYGGIDQRFINEFVDEELSIGDYVLSGGELAAATVIDTVARMIDGVLGHKDSAHQDSFVDGFLECPNFTRPRLWHDQEVPEILTSGDHKKIEHWREKIGKLVTLYKRPDLFWRRPWKKEEVEELKDFFIGLSEKDKKAVGLSDLSLPLFLKNNE